MSHAPLRIGSYNIGAVGLLSARKMQDVVECIVRQASLTDHLLLHELGHVEDGVDAALIHDLRAKLEDHFFFAHTSSYACVWRRTLPGNLTTKILRLNCRQETPRYFQHILWELSGTRVLSLGNVHLRSSKNCPLSDETRRLAFLNGLKEIATQGARYNAVAGDFNCRQSHPRQAGILDMVDEHPRALVRDHVSDASSFLFLTHPAVSPIVRPISRPVAPRTYASDAHVPLFVDLSLSSLLSDLVPHPTPEEPRFQQATEANHQLTIPVPSPTHTSPLALGSYHEAARDWDSAVYGRGYMDLHTGMLVKVTTPPEESLGWVYVENIDGRCGWAPPAYLKAVAEEDIVRRRWYSADGYNVCENDLHEERPRINPMSNQYPLLIQLVEPRFELSEQALFDGNVDA